VATDTVANLTTNMRGVETIELEVMGASESEVRERLERIAGIAKIVAGAAEGGRAHLTIEAAKDQNVRPEIARAGIGSNWQLHELHGVSLSLEDIFLELTGSNGTPEPTQEERGVA